MSDQDVQTAVDVTALAYELKTAMHYNPDTGRNFEDIATILAGWFVAPEGYEDRDGVWLVEFNDGARHAFFGGHDSTGWDCQSGLDLLPFDGWEERLRSEPDYRFGDYGYSGSKEQIIASLRQQLAVQSTPVQGEEQ